MSARTDWQETIDPGEQARFEEYARVITEAQASRGPDGSLDRGVHAKPHVCVHAELVVDAGVPDEAKVGIFAAPGRYDAFVRYSNGAQRRQSDRKPDPRGLAFKVVGVPGKKLLPGLEDAVTQDFLLIQMPNLGFKSADDLMHFAVAAEKPLTLLPKLIGRHGLFGAFRLIGNLKKMVETPMSSLATTRFYNPAATKWGEHAGKVQLRPLTAPEPGAKQGASPEFFAEEMTERLAREAVEYELLVQLYTDPTRTPIEDTSVTWTEEASPAIHLGRLVIPKQDLRSDEGRALTSRVERMAWNPWHAPVEFRPLGNAMRARKIVYAASAKKRESAPEPTEGASALLASA